MRTHSPLHPGQPAQSTLESLISQVERLSRATPQRSLGTALTGVIYGAALALFLWVGATLEHRLQLTGDEPWYILQALGLARLHSANLAPLIANHAIFDPLVHHWDDHTADFLGNGERVLPNLPGYAAAIAPWYVLTGRKGIIGFQALVAALTATLVYMEARRQFRSILVAFFAMLALLFALPSLFYVAQVFPSTLATGAAFGGFVLASRVLPATTGRWQLVVAAATGVVAGALPWLHSKYALAALALVAVAALAVRLPLRLRHPLDDCGRQAWCAIGVMAGVLALSFAGIVLYSRHYFGTWTPRISAAGGAMDLAHPDVQRALNLLNDMFLDPQSGLIPWVPLAVLVPVGLMLLWRRDRRSAGMLLLMLAGLLGAFAPVLFTRDIYQGYALPSRFTVECAPYFALAEAAVLAAARPDQSLVQHMRMLHAGRWRMHSRSAVVAARIGLALACLGLLLVGAYFDRVGLHAPRLLYHSTAGPRIVEEYPDLLPAWWFAAFTWTPDNFVPAAMVPFVPDSALHQLRVDRVEAPPGRYAATVTFICSTGEHGSVPVTLRVERNTTRGARMLDEWHATVICTTQPTPTAALSFLSDGYESVNVVIALPPDHPSMQASLAYHRVAT